MGWFEEGRPCEWKDAARPSVGREIARCGSKSFEKDNATCEDLAWESGDFLES